MLKEKCKQKIEGRKRREIKKNYETATNKIAKYNSVNNYFKYKLSKYTIKDRVAMHNCSSP